MSRAPTTLTLSQGSFGSAEIKNTSRSQYLRDARKDRFECGEWRRLWLVTPHSNIISGLRRRSKGVRA
jgi:hypothetical protein